MSFEGSQSFVDPLRKEEASDMESTFRQQATVSYSELLNQAQKNNISRANSTHAVKQTQEGNNTNNSKYISDMTDTQIQQNKSQKSVQPNIQNHGQQNFVQQNQDTSTLQQKQDLQPITQDQKLQQQQQQQQQQELQYQQQQQQNTQSIEKKSQLQGSMQRLPYTLMKPENKRLSQQSPSHIGRSQNQNDERDIHHQVQQPIRSNYVNQNQDGQQFAKENKDELNQSYGQLNQSFINGKLKDKDLWQLGRLEIKVLDPVQESKQHKHIPAYLGWKDTYMTYNIVVYIINQEDIRREFCIRRRRFRELVALHEIIKQKFCGYFIPPRPEKNQNNVQDRCLQMEKYLNQLASHPILSTSKELELFLLAQGDLDTNQMWSQVAPLGFMESTSKLLSGAQQINFQSNQAYNNSLTNNFNQQLKLSSSQQQDALPQSHTHVDQYLQEGNSQKQTQPQQSQQQYQQQQQLKESTQQQQSQQQQQLQQQSQQQQQVASSSQLQSSSQPQNQQQQHQTQQQEESMKHRQISEVLVKGIDLTQLGVKSVFENRNGFNLQEQLLFKIKRDFEGEKESMSNLEKMSQSLVSVEKEYCHAFGDLGVQISHIHRSTCEHLEIKDIRPSQSNMSQNHTTFKAPTINKMDQYTKDQIINSTKTESSKEQQNDFSQDMTSSDGSRFLESLAPEATDSQLGIYKAASEQFLRSQQAQGRTVIKLVEGLEAIQNHLAMLPRAIKALEEREKALQQSTTSHNQLQIRLQKIFEQEAMLYPLSLQQSILQSAYSQQGKVVSHIKNPQHKIEIGNLEQQVELQEIHYKKLLLRNLEELSRYRLEKKQQLEEMVIKFVDAHYKANNDLVVEWVNMASQMGASQDEIEGHVSSNYQNYLSEGSHVKFEKDVS